MLLKALSILPFLLLLACIPLFELQQPLFKLVCKLCHEEVSLWVSTGETHCYGSSLLFFMFLSRASIVSQDLCMLLVPNLSV